MATIKFEIERSVDLDSVREYAEKALAELLYCNDDVLSDVISDWIDDQYDLRFDRVVDEYAFKDALLEALRPIGVQLSIWNMEDCYGAD